MSSPSPLTACDSHLQYQTGRSALNDDDDADHDADADADGQPEESDAMDMTGVEHTGTATASSSTVQPSPSTTLPSSFSSQPVASTSTGTTSAMQGMHHTMQVNAQPLPLSAPVGSTVPLKRGRGRPKGSTTKKFLTLPTDGPITPPAKRPVGRPRKDGLPPGSLSKFKAESLQFSAALTPTTVAQPPVTAYPNSFGNHTPLFTTVPRPFTSPPVTASASASTSTTSTAGLAPRSHSPPVDPTPTSNPTPSAPSVPSVSTTSTNGDDWAIRLSQNPNDFLATLIISLFAPNPTPLVSGPTVEEAFQTQLHSLDLNTNLNLYSTLKTFWVPTSAPYFALTASTSAGGQMPSEYRFFYWDPLPLVFNGIACYYCGAGLVNKGRISSGPIKIYDIDKPFFIIGCEYICTSATCRSATASTGGTGRKFASTDATILGFLPGRLYDEFPARLVNGDKDRGSGLDVWNWTAQGVSRPLWNMVVAGLKAGLSKTQILAQIVSMRAPSWETGGPGVIQQTQAQGQQGRPTSTTVDPALVDSKKHGAPAPAQSASLHVPRRRSPQESESNVNQHRLSPAATPSAVIDPALHQASIIVQHPPPNSTAPAPAATAPPPPPPLVSVQPMQSAVYAHHHPFLPYPYMPFHPLTQGVPPGAPIPTQHQQHVLQHQTQQLQVPQLQTPNQTQQPQQHVPPAAVTPSSSSTHSPAPHIVATAGPTPHQHTLTLASSSPQPPTGSAASQPSNNATSSPAPGTLSIVAPPSGVPATVHHSAPGPSGGPPPSSTHIFASSTISTVSGVSQPKRAPRSCCKCGSQACPGKAQRSYCKSPCRDCGKLDCRGRNSKRPDKTCSEGWG